MEDHAKVDWKQVGIKMEADWKQTGNLLEVDWKQIRNNRSILEADKKQCGRRPKTVLNQSGSKIKADWKQTEIEYFLPMKMYYTTLFLQWNTNSKPYKG